MATVSLDMSTINDGASFHSAFARLDTRAARAKDVAEASLKLQQVQRFAMSLPSVTEEPHFNYSSFRVRGKIFATVPPEGQHLHVFVEEEQRQIALALEPKSAEKLLWGKKVVGLRIALAEVKASFVEYLLQQAWSRKAPKRLLAAYGRPSGVAEP